MKNHPQSQKVTVQFEGNDYSASYTTKSGLITVNHIMYGYKTTQVGGMPERAIAATLFREILQDAKSNGSLET